MATYNTQPRHKSSYNRVKCLGKAASTQRTLQYMTSVQKHNDHQQHTAPPKKDPVCEYTAYVSGHNDHQQHTAPPKSYSKDPACEYTAYFPGHNDHQQHTAPPGKLFEHILRVSILRALQDTATTDSTQN